MKKKNIFGKGFSLLTFLMSISFASCSSPYDVKDEFPQEEIMRIYNLLKDRYAYHNFDFQNSRINGHSIDGN